MKPKAPTEHEDGLLEYLEDIIGTSKYKGAIEEALVKVDAHGEEIGEKKARLGIVVRELNGLKVRRPAPSSSSQPTPPCHLAGAA